MTDPAPRQRSAEDIAVPELKLVEEIVEGIAVAAVRLLPHKLLDAEPKQHVIPSRQVMASPPRFDKKFPAVLWFPTIDNETPLGPSLDNPMGEGSEDTAVPVIDPVEVRLGQMQTLPDPLP